MAAICSFAIKDAYIYSERDSKSYRNIGPPLRLNAPTLEEGRPSGC
jgi:hypothetical protein